ncbi:MAG: DUF5710 domain-containing protein [Smithella sp.]|jgi:hypothetical protein
MDTRLFVPFSEKDVAKKSGALWDKANNTWYIPGSLSRANFMKWLGKGDADSINIFSKKTALAWSWESCWKCDNPCPVLMFVVKDNAGSMSYDENTDNYYDSTILKNAMVSHTLFIDPSISVIIRKYFPFYHKDRSKDAGKSYWMNHCLCCGARLGDQYLISEPEDPFNPIPDSDPLIVFINLPAPEFYYYSISGIENYTDIDRFINKRSFEWSDFSQRWNYKLGLDKNNTDPFTKVGFWIELFYSLHAL